MTAPLLLAALLALLPAVATQEPALDATPSCPESVSVRGGTVSLSDGFRPGSILTYSCPDGSYPYPTRSRICQSDGKWTPMRSSGKSPVSQAQCRKISCPPQRSFENGSFGPRRGFHPVGAILSFECSDGYQLLGSSRRHCLPNGRWNGTSPVCDDGAGHCPSVAIPPGAIATGGRNRLGDRVSFQCQSGLDLVGSSQRVCTPEGEWSGAEPSCRAPYSYDRAEDVRAEFGASFTEVLSDVSSSGPDPSETTAGESEPRCSFCRPSWDSEQRQRVTYSSSLGRRLILSKDSFLYVYFLVDASHSVTETNFNISKQCLEVIITRIASFDVPIRFSVISYASRPKTIVNIQDDIAEDTEIVIEKIQNEMNYKDHGNATGTNIQDALDSVYQMMINEKEFTKVSWDKIRHAVILFTDGKSNMGGSPTKAVRSIEDFLNVRANRKDYLDIYAFGVGTVDVDWSAMNEIASKKPGERHAFKLNDLKELKAAFEDVLDPRDLHDICGLANNSDSASWEQKNPWHVLLHYNTLTEPSCRGALISKTWVLTSAHCFSKFNDTAGWIVILEKGAKGRGGTRLRIKRRIDHELFNVKAKVAQGIQEFYDYDLSLLELEKPVQFGGRIRPICLPCTEGANRALKMKPGATCKDHELQLLSLEEVDAQFVSLDNKRMGVQIKTRRSRPTCISAALQDKKMFSEGTDASEVVTDRFLCSGGGRAVEAATCKGESGGSLFVERRERLFQVGVISWGTYNPCEKKRKKKKDGRRRWKHLGSDIMLLDCSGAAQTEAARRQEENQGGRTRNAAFGPAVLHSHCLGAFYTDAADYACDPQTAEIAGGRYTALENGTVLKYECPDGKYPYPTDYRFCQYDGTWSPMRNALKSPVSKASCRNITCFRPLDFENGLYEPRQRSYSVGQELRFECYQGYTLRGSQNRTCLPNGKWSGETTICDDGAGHCPNPGIPIGAQKDGTQYRIEDRVRYSCDRGLAFVGSKERICQESGAWSGSEPECRNPFTFDTPEEVSSKFISSLTEVVESADSNRNISATGKRKIKIEVDGSMNIYIVLDASRSIGRPTFQKARDAIIKFIEKISSYDTFPRYGIVTFATHSKEVLSTTNAKSNDASWVIEQLEAMKYNEHKLKPGTNIYKGLDAVYKMMINQQEDQLREGLDPAPIATTTRHVILLLTDGDYNMGGTPVPVIGRIKEFLGIPGQPARNDFLDVYIFGIGTMVAIENVNALASQKPGERHVFKLKDYDEVRDAFEEMIDESQVLSMCGLAKEHTQARDQEKNPWHVTISIRRAGRGFEHCKGALVSEYYVLTAAHCFTINDKAEEIQVKLGENQRFEVAAVRSHPLYQIGKLEDRGIREFYDYDVALVKLAKKVTPSVSARPICLPCTAGTTRALRKPHPQTTCRNHEELLLTIGNVPSFFVTDCKHEHEQGNGLSRRTVKIRNSEKKIGCEADAKKASYYENVTDVSQVVTERFLCTGGADPEVDPNTCKGDSGGPLIIPKRQRYIQVGVISWGVVDVCRNKKLPVCETGRNRHEMSPAYARDFHINLFKVLPWLKEELREEGLDFL
ncbi:complement factor B [Lacerta agilis]|uniref:complement factor B n=1 Tax=Lacerta agilis TaxID=80427 RepID=UPI001419F3B2|nr:complement factor B [Lacerta agilis]